MLTEKEGKELREKAIQEVYEMWIETGACDDGVDFDEYLYNNIDDAWLQ